LTAKGVDFERRWVDMADKPAWFVAASSLSTGLSSISLRKIERASPQRAS
jgi:hypothetical protein